MSTPGTAAWLREMSEKAAYQDFREGLMRAAHRIERLQNQLGMQRTGVDQSVVAQAPPVRRVVNSHLPAFQPSVETPAGPVFRIRLPKGDVNSDRKTRDSVFEWIAESENLGLGLLDPCAVHLNGRPDVEGGTWDLDTTLGISTFRKDRAVTGFVHLSWVDRTGPFGLMESSCGCVNLTDSFVADVITTDDETIVELTAKSVEVV